MCSLSTISVESPDSIAILTRNPILALSKVLDSRIGCPMFDEDSTIVPQAEVVFMQIYDKGRDVESLMQSPFSG